MSAPFSVLTKAAGPGGHPIALLVNVLGSGGAQRRIATLANRFAELGRTVEVISVEPGGPMREMLAPEVGVAILVPAGTSRRVSNAVHARQLANHVKRSAPSVLLSCVTDTHLLAVAASLIDCGKIPLILRASRHPFRPIAPRAWLKRAVEPFNLRKAAFCYTRADAVIALSEDNARGLRRLTAPHFGRIEVIPNPVVAEISHAALDARSRRIGGPTPLILGIGRLVEQKDFATLIAAFAKLRVLRPARLVLLGEGTERERLEGLASRLGIAADVDLPGEVDDIPAWMARADLVVSSSLWEDLQSTLIEALAAGCPVVATDCPGGAREILDHGRRGALVAVRSPAAMTRAMVVQLDRNQDPWFLAAGAERFTAHGKAEAYLTLFDDLVRSGRRPEAPIR